MTFVYVSGAGTGGKAMWAQVKKRTEDALLALFPSAYMVRLGALRPMHREVSKTRWTRIGYAALSAALAAGAGDSARGGDQHRGAGSRHDPRRAAGCAQEGAGDARPALARGAMILREVVMRGNRTVKEAVAYDSPPNGDGEIAGLKTVIGSTGSVQGATGLLRIYGTLDSAHPSDVRYTGQLCTPRR
jgi:hypothetical protein